MALVAGQKRQRPPGLGSTGREMFDALMNSPGGSRPEMRALVVEAAHLADELRRSRGALKAPHVTGRTKAEHAEAVDRLARLLATIEGRA